MTDEHPAGWRHRLLLPCAGGALIVFLCVMAWWLGPSLRARWSGVPLVLRYPPGRTVRQRTSVSFKGSLDVRGLPPELSSKLQGKDVRDVQARLDLVGRTRVKSVGGDGTGELEVATESCLVQVGAWSSSLPCPPSSVRRVDACGRDLGGLVAGTLPAPQRAALDLLLSRLGAGFLRAEPSRVGEGWSYPVDLAISDSGMDIRLTGRLEHALDGLEKVDGCPLAVVGARQVLKLEASPVGGGQGGNRVSGTYDGRTRFLLSLERGMLHRVEGRGDLSVTFRATLPRLEGRGVSKDPVDGKVQGTVIYTMEAQVVEP